MKFSYTLLKAFVPKLRDAEEVRELLTNHLFEVEGIEGDTIDIKILANRYSDAASYFGLARVLATLKGVSPKIPSVSKRTFSAVGKPKIGIEAKKECRRLAAILFDSVAVGPSPEWLRRALEASGIRSINNLVDITNYVMLETGQPLHAFDYDRMQGDLLRVRAADDREELTTLDGKDLLLPAGTLVLADANRALDLAGIKGGKPAEITATSTRILLTAANFIGAPIYTASRQTGISTDASLRFSHSLSPALVAQGLFRAADLIEEMCGGVAHDPVQSFPKPEVPRTLSFDSGLRAEIEALGISVAKASKWLTGLGYGVTKNRLTVPILRTDVTTARDVLDDIVSMAGYDSIPAVAPHMEIAPTPTDSRVFFRERVRDFLVRARLTEVYTHSFTGERGPLELENALSEERRYLRTSLSPHLERAIELNKKYRDEVCLFEIGTVFSRSPEGGAFEHESLSIAISGIPTAARVIRGIVEALYASLGISHSAVAEGSHSLRYSARDGSDLGILTARSDSGAFFEVSLGELETLATKQRVFRAPPKYPSIVRDVSLYIPQGVRAGDLIAVSETAASSLLEELLCIDAYEPSHSTNSGQAGAPRRSLTFRFVFRAPDRTLTDQDVDRELKIILDALTLRYHIEVR